MKKLRLLYGKYKEIILYLLFGLITTVVSLLACYLTIKIGVRWLHDENGDPTELLDILGSTTQWVSGVVVAFITNKLWVFTEAQKGHTGSQFLKFAGSRVATYFLEVVINLGAIALIDWLGYREFAVFGFLISSRVWAKLISSVFVVVSNYFISKLFVFKNKKTLDS